MGEVEWGDTEPEDMTDEELYDWLSTTWTQTTKYHVRRIIDVWPLRTVAHVTLPHPVDEKTVDAVTRALRYFRDHADAS